MIKCYASYKMYLAADRRALGSPKGLWAIWTNEILRYQRSLRRLEFVLNSRKNAILIRMCRYMLRRNGLRLGFSISPNVFGPGLSIAHRGTIVVNGGARIGANCRIHVDVNIGTEAGQFNVAPVIGDNCYIAPGVKMFGKIFLGDNMVIGANAVVNKSFPSGNCTIAGVPAKVISNKTSENLLIKGYLRP